MPQGLTHCVPFIGTNYHEDKNIARMYIYWKTLAAVYLPSVSTRNLILMWRGRHKSFCHTPNALEGQKCRNRVTVHRGYVCVCSSIGLAPNTNLYWKSASDCQHHTTHYRTTLKDHSNVTLSALALFLLWRYRPFMTSLSGEGEVNFSTFMVYLGTLLTSNTRRQQQ